MAGHNFDDCGKWNTLESVAKKNLVTLEQLKVLRSNVEQFQMVMDMKKEMKLKEMADWYAAGAPPA